MQNVSKSDNHMQFVSNGAELVQFILELMRTSVPTVVNCNTPKDIKDGEPE